MKCHSFQGKFQFGDKSHWESNLDISGSYITGSYDIYKRKEKTIRNWTRKHVNFPDILSNSHAVNCHMHLPAARTVLFSVPTGGSLLDLKLFTMYSK